MWTRPVNRLRLALALASLGLGAVVTVLVSWSIALYADPHNAKAVEGAAWPGPAGPGWSPAARFVTPYSTPSAFGGLHQWSAWGSRDGGYSGDFHMFVTHAGWPLYAMQSTLCKDEQHWNPKRGPYDNDGSFEAGLSVPLHWSHPHEAGSGGWLSRRLPLQPMPLGFAANSCIAAIAVGALIALWRLQPARV
ncbi:MAG: hypothetical protein AABZ53_15370, partial [Planctomycetota bacterium]